MKYLRLRQTAWITKEEYSDVMVANLHLWACSWMVLKVAWFGALG